jgi:AraC family transcriptional regulator
MFPSAFVQRERIFLAGVGFFGDPFQISGDWTSENEIGRLWERFMAYQRAHPDQMPDVLHPEVGYELHIEHDLTAKTGEYEIFIGQEIQKPEQVPPELLLKVLPPVTYAVFTLKGQEIVSDWEQAISQEWFPTSGYRRAYHYGFQYYDRRFKGLDAIDESEIDLYLPVTSQEC